MIIISCKETFYQVRDCNHFIVNYINFWSSGLSLNGFYSILNLCLYLLHVVGAYKIYTYFVPWFFSEIAIGFIWPCTLKAFFHLLLNRTASYFFTIINTGFVQLLVTYYLFLIQFSKEIKIMMYVASIIRFRVFSELLRKSTLLAHCKLNIFWPPLVNQFDICALLFGGYDRFITLYKWYYMVIGDLTSGSSSMSQLTLTLSLLCNGLLF